MSSPLVWVTNKKKYLIAGVGLMITLEGHEPLSDSESKWVGHLVSSNYIKKRKSNQRWQTLTRTCFVWKIKGSKWSKWS